MKEFIEDLLRPLDKVRTAWFRRCVVLISFIPLLIITIIVGIIVGACEGGMDQNKPAHRSARQRAHRKGHELGSASIGKNSLDRKARTRLACLA